MATKSRSPLGSLVPRSQGTPNGRTRRSWFCGTPHKEEVTQEDVPILKLTYFTKKVMLCFDDVLIGKAKTRYLRIENPCDFIQTVYLEKFPFDKGFNVTEREWILQGEEHLLLPITWCPIKDGNVRELVTFKFEGMHRLQIILLGTAKPAKVKKQRRTLGSIQPSKRSTLKKVHEKKLRPSRPPWQQIEVENVDPALNTKYVKRKSDCKMSKNSTRNSLDLDTTKANFQKDEGLKATGVTDVSVESSPVHAVVTNVSVGSSPVHAGVTDVSVGSSPVHAGVTDVSVGSSPVHAGVADVSAESSPVHAGVADVFAESSPVHDEFEHGSTLPTEMLTIQTNIKRETVVLSDLPCSPAVALNLPDVSDSDTTYVVSKMRANESLQCERSPTPTQNDCQEEHVKDVDLRFTSATITKSKQVGSKTESCINSARVLPFNSLQDNEKTGHGSLEWIALNNKKDSSTKADSKKKCLTKTSRTADVLPLQRRSITSKVSSKRTRDDSTESKKRVKKSEVSIPLQKIALKPKKSDRKSYKGKTAMKGVAMSHLKLSKCKATAIPRHPMPFAAKNMFYDERWIEKQERGFVKWLNYILTPDEYSSDPKCKSTKVDAAKLFMSASNTTNVGAPSKEVLSLRAYSAKRCMSSLRRGACSLFQSEPVVRVIQKIESEVERGGLDIRKDKHVHADYGIKQNFLNMMLSYNPLWLRIGLETIYGEMLPIENNADVVGLSRFIVTRMLSNPDIAAQFSHPTVPALFKQGYEDCLNKFILKKFLMLVFFLDRAKLTRLIDHNPCLFCKDAEFKSSRMLLLSFSREYLKGEGDVTRHLSFLGYCVTHKQTPLDEFDFAVTNIATDLRCGVRLARIVELLLRDWKLLHELRVPAISRLQKIHNMEVAFKAIKKNFPAIEGSAVDPKAIVDGHREKTLKLLWTIIFHLQVGSLLNKEQLKNEISFLKRNKLVHASLASIQSHGGSDRPINNLNESDVNFKNEELSLLFQWCKAVCSIYNLQIDNFTVSFSDGRALCYLVHHYNPTLLPFDKVQQATTQQQWQQSGHQSDGDDSFDGTWKNTFNPSTDTNADFEKLLENERANYKLLFDKVKELGGVPLMIKCKDMTNTIPDEKVVITYVTYLCVRLLDLHHESCSARVIQSAWRLYKMRKSIRLNKLKETSVVVIQRAARRYLRNVQYKKTTDAVVKIQTWYRCILAKKTLCNLRQAQLMKEKEGAAKILQHWFRCYLERKHFVRLRQASVLLQAAVRGYQARKYFNSMRKAAVVVQTRYRSLQCSRQTRQRYILYRTAVVNLQTAIRGHLARKFTKRVKAARLIQAAWRAYKAKSGYVEILKATVKIQALFRGYRAFKNFKRMKAAALVLQRRYHANKKMLIQQMIYGITRGACITIQAAFRAYRCRKNYKNLRRKIISMQSLVRMKKIRKEFLEKRQAALTIQCHFRAYSQGCSARHDYNRLKSATVKVQAIFRAILARRQTNNIKAAIKLQAFFKMVVARSTFLQQKEAAVKLQSSFRRYSYQMSYQKLRSTTLFLQRNFRNNKKAGDCRTVYQQKRKAAIVIQASYRGLVVKRNYLKVLASVIKLQSNVRCKQQRNQFLKTKNAAVILQTKWRSYQLACKIFQKYQQKKKACIVIQSTFRGYILRKQMMERNRAAIYIQNFYRTYKARSSYVMLCMATKTLQRKWRAFITGRRQHNAYKKTISATIKIQSVYRGYQSRKVFQAKKNAVIIIQSLYRGYQNKKMFHRKKKAAILIQSVYRSYHSKTIFQEKKKAAIIIQSAYRGYRSRKVFLEKKTTVTMIQSVYRGYQNRKVFQVKKKAAILIQSVYRSYRDWKAFQEIKKATILIQSVYRCYQSRNVFQKKKNAAILIQSIYRGYQSRKVFLKKKKAAILIQSIYRGYQNQKLFQEKKKAAILIQSVYRRYRNWKAFQEIKKATILIQSVYRCYQIRNVFQKKKKAAILIQSIFRGYQRRKVFQAKKKAAITIQSVYRSCQTRKVFQEKKKAVIIIQSVYRGYQNRKVFQMKKNAAILIQSVYRSYQSRKVFLKKKKAAILIQSIYRGYQNQKLFQEKKKAAILIQSVYRSYRNWKAFQEIRKATILIQSVYRCYQSRNVFQKKKNAAILIQSIYRGYQSRKGFQAKKKAAITIQSVYRSCQTRKVFQEKKKAVIMIQSVYRGYQNRKVFQLKKNAAILIQSVYRSYQSRKVFLKKKKAAILIQSIYRGYQNQKMFQEKKNAAILIQSVYRSYRNWKAFQEIKKATILIQSVYRCYQSRNVFQKKKNAAILIQSIYRGYQSRKGFQAKKKAAITIQSVYRSCQTRKVFQEKKKAVIMIQSVYRGYQNRKVFQLKKNAAILIQSVYRSYQSRKVFLKKKKAAILIQSIYRGYQNKKMFQEKKNAAILIQSVYRSYRNWKSFQEIKKATILIQSVYRCYQIRNVFQKNKKAAILIQSIFRGYQRRKVFKAKKKAAITIQSVYRSCQTRKVFQEKKKAVIMIQSVYRGYQNRKVFQLKKNAAILIQSVYRSHQSRKVFLKKQKAAILIQSIYRGYQNKKMFQEKKKAAILIQSVYRGYQIWKDLREKKKAAILIQSVYRGYHSRRVFHEKKKAAILIQSFYRGYQNRRVYQEKKKAAILIQSIYRGYHSRMLFKEQKKAAILIQSVVRKWIAQQRYSQLKRAALILQVYYRARMMRDICFASFQKKKNAAVRLQACFRRHIVSKNYQLKQKSAIRIQACVRGFLQRKKYLRYRDAVLSMQRRYRAKVKGEYDRFVFQYKRGACIVLQSQFRGFLVRSKMKKLNSAACCIQAAYRCHRQVTRYKEIQNSTAVIQTRWRAVLAGQKQREHFLHIKSVTCFLQKMVRRYLAAQITKRQKSATIIQSYYRMHKQRKSFRNLRSSVVLLQAYFRCYRSRQHFIKVKKAVSVLQTQYRLWKVMRTAQRNYQCTRVAAIKMQALFRCNRERKHYLKLRSCVVSMQANIRCKRVRKQFLQLKQSVVYLQGKYRSLVKCRQDYIDYHYKRGATIVIQATFRGYIVRERYQSILKATVKLQAATRKYIQQKRYQDKRNAVACLQLYFRAFRKGKVQRRIYLLKKSSAITIQCTYRRYACRKVEKRLKAAVTIQASYRCYRQRQRFIHLQSSTMRIQRYFRCWQTRKNFLKMKAAAQVIQRHYKSLLVSRECQNRYKCMLNGFTKLQAVFRGRQIRKDLCRQRAATCIQAWFRMYAARKFWLGFRCNVIHLQALIRGWQARKQFKLTLKQHRAASCLQKTFKNYIALKRIKEAEKLREVCIQRFAAAVYINLAAIRLQRRYRCFKALKLAKQRLHSLIIIQRWMKSRLQRMHYLKLRRGMVALQKVVRAHQHRRCKAAIILQSYIRMYLLQKQIKNINMAALYIQSIWRGYCIRKKMKSKKLKLIRGRCIAANKEATEEKKLCNRTETALDYIMRYKQVSHILEALRNLDVVTRLSPVCCERLVEGQALPVIFLLIKNCNRSLPCMEVVKYCISILTNLAKYNKTCEAVYEIPDCIGFLVELIQMYREKSKLFVSICNLLAVFCQNQQYAQEIRRQSRVAEKIQSIHLLTSRKHKLAVQRNIAKNRSLNASSLTISNSSFASSFICNAPSKRKQFSPDWDLTGNPGRSFEDPLSVIELLMKLLQLKPK